MIVFHDEVLLAPHTTPRLEDYTFLAVPDWLFKLFTATFHIWRSSCPSATKGCAMP